jgi:hypothetical protein
LFFEGFGEYLFSLLVYVVIVKHAKRVKYIIVPWRRGVESYKSFAAAGQTWEKKWGVIEERGVRVEIQG